MTQRRVTATNQLSTVIDVLQLGKKTGILTVERGEGETYEEGRMTFVNGQVVQAVISPYVGRDAATKLFSWQACRFSFVPTLPEQAAQSMRPALQTQTEAKVVTENTQEPLYKIQQTGAPYQDNLGDPPSVIVYFKESMDETLRTLEQRGLSRIHRRLFLLIDGRRSIRELAMLISRTPNDTVFLLTELRRAGLIQ
jgi:hypothetical protein